MQSTFGIDPSDIISISAKTGKNVESILEAIIKRIPPPNGSVQAPLKAFLFDSLWTSFSFKLTMSYALLPQVWQVSRRHFAR